MENCRYIIDLTKVKNCEELSMILEYLRKNNIDIKNVIFEDISSD